MTRAGLHRAARSALARRAAARHARSRAAPLPRRSRPAGSCSVLSATGISWPSRRARPFTCAARSGARRPCDELVAAAAGSCPDGDRAARRTRGRGEHLRDLLRRARCAHAASARAPSPARTANPRRRSHGWRSAARRAARRRPARTPTARSSIYEHDARRRRARPPAATLGAEVVAGLEACGVEPDVQGVTASEELVVRSLESWQRAVRSWIANPTQEQAVMLVSVFVDSRPVWGIHMGTPDRRHVQQRSAQRGSAAPARAPGALLPAPHRLPAGPRRRALRRAPRTSSTSSAAALLPIVDLARWAGMAAGVTSASTRERLRAAADGGHDLASDRPDRSRTLST